MRKNLKIDYTCKNESCNHEFEIECTPYTPAKTYGLFEQCYPAEGGEVEPTECPECGTEIDMTIVEDKIQDASEPDYDGWEEEL